MTDAVRIEKTKSPLFFYVHTAHGRFSMLKTTRRAGEPGQRRTEVTYSVYGHDLDSFGHPKALVSGPTQQSVLKKLKRLGY